MPKPPPSTSSSSTAADSSSIPLTQFTPSGSSLRPQPGSASASQQGSSSDLVHLSKETSRQNTPSTDFPSPERYEQHRDRTSGSDEISSSYDLASPNADMPSDLRPSLDIEHKSSHHQPLLSSDKSRHSYDSDSRPGLHSRTGSRTLHRDARAEAAAATRKRYTYAAGFLMVSLVTFAVQTETAVYIQHNLHWNKAYCML